MRNGNRTFKTFESLKKKTGIGRFKRPFHRGRLLQMSYFFSGEYPEKFKIKKKKKFKP